MPLYLACKSDGGDVTILGIFSKIGWAKLRVESDFERHEKAFPFEKMQDTIDWGLQCDFDNGHVRMAVKMALDDKASWRDKLTWFEATSEAEMAYYGDSRYKFHYYTVLSLELDNHEES